MQRFLFAIAALALVQNLHAADFDSLANRTITFKSSNPTAAMDAFAADPIAVFKTYTPVLAPGSTLVQPFQVSGSQSHPILTMTVQECAFIFCETVQFDAAISIQEPKGGCARNLQIEADLSHSGDTLRDVYDRFEVDLCMKPAPGGGSVQVIAQAHRASAYQAGTTQQKILSFLQLQIPPIANNLQVALSNESGL